MQPETVLVILAHPDDESLACGGTLARLADTGARVVLFSATQGERGGPTGPVRDDALGRIRVSELMAAARTLGISNVILTDHPDGELRWGRVPELHAEIVTAVRRFKPCFIITFGADGLYWHPDHIGVHERTMTALLTLGTAAPPVYCVTTPRGIVRGIVDLARSRGWVPPAKGLWSLEPDSFGLHAEPPTVVVDVRPWVDRKLAALHCHVSQMGNDQPFDRLDRLEARQWLGTEHYHQLAPRHDHGPLERLLAASAATIDSRDPPTLEARSRTQAPVNRMPDAAAH